MKKLKNILILISPHTRLISTLKKMLSLKFFFIITFIYSNLFDYKINIVNTLYKERHLFKLIRLKTLLEYKLKRAI